MKPRIFIGSSSEKKTLKILDQVIEYLEPVAEIVPWTNENVFSPNKGNMENLIKQAKLSDFALLIATKDDLLDSDGVMKEIARDNVIFEFGLFLGSTALDRSFLLVEKGVNLPSDFDGMGYYSFVEDEEAFNSLKKRCKTIVNTITQNAKKSNLGFVPSTALAIGYFHSFVKKVCDEIIAKGHIMSGGEKIAVKNFKLNIVIPDNIDDDGVNNFAAAYNKYHNLTPASTYTEDATKRGYPFHFKIEIPAEDQDKPTDIFLHDVPTTLNTILEAIKMYYPTVQVGNDEDKEHIERRELENFANVITYYINRNTNTRNRVEVLRNQIV